MSDVEVEYRDKDWETTDYHKLVLKIAKRCFRVMAKETEGFNPRTRWLVYGRVVLAIFADHFGMSYMEAVKTQTKAQGPEAAP